MGWTDFIGPAISALGSVGGALISGDAANTAADQQVDAIDKASFISAAASDQARKDVLETFSPAFSAFTAGVQQGSETLLSGRDSSANFLNAATQGAANVLQATGVQGREALLGQPAGQRPMGQQRTPEGQQLIQPMSSRSDSQQKPIPMPGQPDFERNYNALNDPQYADRPGSNVPLQTAQEPGYGLSGALQSLQQGASQAGSDISTGAGRQIGQLQQGYARSIQDLERGTQGALDMLGNPAQVQAASSAAGTYDMGGVRQDVQGGVGRAVGQLSNYRGAGDQALQQEAALSGALGPEAQQRAQEAFTESPGQAFLRQRQEEALLRNNAAIGGLGGGNVRTALQEQAYGIAGQQQQQYLENLRNLATRGQSAAGQQAGFEQQGGLTLGQIGGSLEGQQMQGQTQVGMANAQNTQSASLANAQSANQASQLGAGYMNQLGQQQAINSVNQGVAAGSVLGNMGTNLGNIALGTGQNQAQYQSQAGRDLSNMYTQQGTSLANLGTNLGTNLSNLESQASTNLANLQTQGGQTQASMLQGLGTNLANLGVGQGATQAQLQQNLGNARSAGTLGQNTAWQGGISGVSEALGRAFA